MRRPFVLLPLLLALAVPAAAQDWRVAPEYDVLLTTYDIQPAVMRLKAGEAVRLRFVNNSNQPHAFSAPGFFRSAQLRRRDAALVTGGLLRVGPLSEQTLVLVPKAGRYKVSGGAIWKRALGMKARIIVE